MQKFIAVTDDNGQNKYWINLDSIKTVTQQSTGRICVSLNDGTSMSFQGGSESAQIILSAIARVSYPPRNSNIHEAPSYYL